MVLQKNVFIERVLPGSIIRKLSEEEMSIYRRPFANLGEERRPTLTWPRQIPISGEPQEVAVIVSDYQSWLEVSNIPKLFIDTLPGAILGNKQRKIVRSWPNLAEKAVPGIHFVQEDSPHEIGQALAEWIPTFGS